MVAHPKRAPAPRQEPSTHPDPWPRGCLLHKDGFVVQKEIAKRPLGGADTRGEDVLPAPLAGAGMLSATCPLAEAVLFALSAEGNLGVWRKSRHQPALMAFTQPLLTRVL